MMESSLPEPFNTGRQSSDKDWFPVRQGASTALIGMGSLRAGYKKNFCNRRIGFQWNPVRQLCLPVTFETLFY
jgi:hypothetical protein